MWRLAARQHGVVSRSQLLDLGFSRDAIGHRIAVGRLHPLWRGVYAVGRPQVARHGEWLAAVLACGDDAVLSHASAAALWRIGREGGRIELSVPVSTVRRRAGLVAHRRCWPEPLPVTRFEGVPVTDVAQTILDLALRLTRRQVERMVDEADKRELIDPETLRRRLGERAGRPGSAALGRIIDRLTFTLTESELERRFLPLAARAGLPAPETGRRVTGFRVDFYWPGLGLVVETDGLRYHRTPAQQARDRVRDQRHAAAGLTPLRFTHAQVAFEPRRVQSVLASVAARLRG